MSAIIYIIMILIIIIIIIIIISKYVISIIIVKLQSFKNIHDKFGMIMTSTTLIYMLDDYYTYPVLMSDNLYQYNNNTLYTCLCILSLI